MRSRLIVFRNVLSICLFVVLGAASAIASDAYDFVAPRYFTAGNTPQGAAVGDFNMDGKLDVATTLNGASAVAILLGNGDGTLQAPVAYSVDHNPTLIVAGDFNNDGYPDLAVDVDSGIRILLNNGDGTFRSGTLISASGVMVVADFNGDGKLDLGLLTLGDCSDEVTVFLGNGDGTFQSGINSASAGCSRDIAVSDFNGDGIPDLAVANQEVELYKQQYGANQLTILLGNGDGTFQQPENYPATARPLAVAVADFNGDAAADAALLYSADSGPVGVDVFLGDGSGVMGSGKNYMIDGNDPAGAGAFLTADFTGNGDAYLTFGDANGIFVFFADGVHPVKNVTQYALSDGYLAAGKFIDNSNLMQGVSPGEATGAGEISILAGNSDAVLAAPRIYPISYGHTSELTTGDFNGDGNLDVLATRAPLPEYPTHIDVNVLPGKGDGTFGPPIVTKVPVHGIRQSSLYVGAGDFNGDGKLDAAIVVTSQQYDYYQTLQILLGKGDGTFTLGKTYQHAHGFGPIQVGDFNHDGHLDIASSCGDGMCILLGKGNGEFADPKVYSVDQNQNASAGALVLGDFRHNGILDIATFACIEGLPCPDVAILLGNGDGTFGAPLNFVQNSGLTGLAAGDFNSDGHLDLAVVGNNFDNGENAGFLLLGDGKGGFRQTSNFAVGDGPVSLAAGDFNLDGNLDLAVGNLTAGPFVLDVLHGKGDGTFDLRIPYPVPGPDPVVVGNFTKNGGPDLVGISDNGVAVYRNTHSH